MACCSLMPDPVLLKILPQNPGCASPGVNGCWCHSLDHHWPGAWMVWQRRAAHSSHFCSYQLVDPMACETAPESLLYSKRLGCPNVGCIAENHVRMSIQAWRTDHPPRRGSKWLKKRPVVHSGFLCCWLEDSPSVRVTSCLLDLATAWSAAHQGRRVPIFFTGLLHAHPLAYPSLNPAGLLPQPNPTDFLTRVGQQNAPVFDFGAALQGCGLPETRADMMLAIPRQLISNHCTATVFRFLLKVASAFVICKSHSTVPVAGTGFSWQWGRCTVKFCSPLARALLVSSKYIRVFEGVTELAADEQAVSLGS